MDAGQDDFAVAFFCKLADFLVNLLGITASHTTSGIRNDTIAAKLIASVLHLQKSSGVFGRCDTAQLLIGLDAIIDIYNIADSLAKIFIQQRRQ